MLLQGMNETTKYPQPYVGSDYNGWNVRSENSDDCRVGDDDADVGDDDEYLL